MQKIKLEDEVIVIAGKDKGKRGIVKQVLKNEKVLVEGINTVKKHVKADPNANDRGGIVVQPRPIHISNVKLYVTETGKGSRVGIRVLDDGKKVRYFKSTNEVVEADV